MYLLVAGLLKTWVASGGADLDTVNVQFWQWIGLVLIARAALLHVHLLLVIHRRYPTALLQVVARVTVAVIALIAVLLSIPVLVPHVHFAAPYWRLVWVLAILDLLGTVIVPLSNALFRPRPADAGVGWPRYTDGTPVPALADGSPDFSGVERG